MNFDGIFTPAVTPLQVDGMIDDAAFAAVLEHLIANGVHGIVVGGSTGEYYAQTADERRRLAERAKDVIGGRIPLVVGPGAIRTEDAVALAEHARSIGADGLLVGSPPYAVPTEQEIATHVLTIDRAAGLPIMLYNYPGRMSVSMGDSFFAAIKGAKNIVAIKESSGDLARLHRLARYSPEIALSCGWDDLALEFFAWGARSWVGAGSNFTPGEHVALYEACVIEKDFDKGRAIMSALLPLMDYLEGGKFVQSIKAGCEMLGLCTRAVRAPLQPLTEEENADLAKIITDLRREVAQVKGARANG